MSEAPKWLVRFAIIVVCTDNYVSYLPNGEFWLQFVIRKLPRIRRPVMASELCCHNYDVTITQIIAVCMYHLGMISIERSETAQKSALEI